MTQSAINCRMLYSIEGTLKDVIPQFEPGSWRTAAEITQERLTNQELRGIGFYTGNFSMHTIEGCNGRDAEFLYLGERAANPIFENPIEATDALIYEHNYRPSKASIDAVVDSVARGTVRVKIADLNLITVPGHEFGYFVIDPENYDAQLNDVQKKVAEKAYGSMQKKTDLKGNETSDFNEAMRMFKRAGKSAPRVKVLNQEYVREHVSKGEAIVRGGWLNAFKYGSDFCADNRNVEEYDALRGSVTSGRRIRRARRQADR